MIRRNYYAPRAETAHVPPRKKVGGLSAIMAIPVPRASGPFTNTYGQLESGPPMEGMAVVEFLMENIVKTIATDTGGGVDSHILFEQRVTPEVYSKCMEEDRCPDASRDPKVLLVIWVLLGPAHAYQLPLTIEDTFNRYAADKKFVIPKDRPCIRTPDDFSRALNWFRQSSARSFMGSGGSIIDDMQTPGNLWWVFAPPDWGNTYARIQRGNYASIEDPAEGGETTLTFHSPYGPNSPHFLFNYGKSPYLFSEGRFRNCYYIGIKAPDELTRSVVLQKLGANVHDVEDDFDPNDYDTDDLITGASDTPAPNQVRDPAYSGHLYDSGFNCTDDISAIARSPYAQFEASRQYPALGNALTFQRYARGDVTNYATFSKYISTTVPLLTQFWKQGGTSIPTVFGEAHFEQQTFERKIARLSPEKARKITGFFLNGSLSDVLFKINNLMVHYLGLSTAQCSITQLIYVGQLMSIFEDVALFHVHLAGVQECGKSYAVMTALKMAPACAHVRADYESALSSTVYDGGQHRRVSYTDEAKELGTNQCELKKTQFEEGVVNVKRLQKDPVTGMFVAAKESVLVAQHSVTTANVCLSGELASRTWECAMPSQTPTARHHSTTRSESAMLAFQCLFLKTAEPKIISSLGLIQVSDHLTKLWAPFQSVREPLLPAIPIRKMKQLTTLAQSYMWIRLTTNYGHIEDDTDRFAAFAMNAFITSIDFSLAYHHFRNVTSSVHRGLIITALCSLARVNIEKTDNAKLIDVTPVLHDGRLVLNGRKWQKQRSRSEFCGFTGMVVSALNTIAPTQSLSPSMVDDYLHKLSIECSDTAIPIFKSDVVQDASVSGCMTLDIVACKPYLLSLEKGMLSMFRRIQHRMSTTDGAVYNTYDEAYFMLSSSIISRILDPKGPAGSFADQIIETELRTFFEANSDSGASKFAFAVALLKARGVIKIADVHCAQYFDEEQASDPTCQKSILTKKYKVKGQQFIGRLCVQNVPIQSGPSGNTLVEEVLADFISVCSNTYHGQTIALSPEFCAGAEPLPTINISPRESEPCMVLNPDYAPDAGTGEDLFGDDNEDSVFSSRTKYIDMNNIEHELQRQHIIDNFPNMTEDAVRDIIRRGSNQKRSHSSEEQDSQRMRYD